MLLLFHKLCILRTVGLTLAMCNVRVGS